MNRRLITAPELAEYIGKTPAAVYQMVSRRQIPFVRLGGSTRFDVQAVDKWIEQQSVKPIVI